MSLGAQEAVLLEDLLYAFMGYEGQYIRFERNYDPQDRKERLSGPRWRIMPGLDPSLQDLALSMLKMASHYAALEKFVDILSQEEYGSVNQALCASIRKFLNEYLTLIAQLETQFLTEDSFTLHVLNVHIQPTNAKMYQLFAVAQDLLRRNFLVEEEEHSSSDEDTDEMNDFIKQIQSGDGYDPTKMARKKTCRGGMVLELLTKRRQVMSGDPAAEELLTSLLRDASKPYMRMLNEWLHRGAITDPHLEFMIRERTSIKRDKLHDDYTDEYWDRRYILCEDEIPPQLANMQNEVLLAGKYLNVVRECGGVDASTDVKDVPQTFDDEHFTENVNGAYKHANSSLMQLLVTTHALPARLQSMKHYFFLDPSDYFSYFLELSLSELKKPVKSVNIGKLQSLLDLVLRQPGSIVSLDPFKEDVQVVMNPVDYVKKLQSVVGIKGFDQEEVDKGQAVLDQGKEMEPDKKATGMTSLELDYNVPFPVSLVISRRTVWQYKTLFRHLLSLRNLESLLCGAWQAHTRGVVWTHKSASPAAEAWKRRAYILRSRMLVFVQSLLYYSTAEVIEPQWQILMAKLRPKEGGGVERTVDQLMQDHADFLGTCLKDCMLTNQKLLRVC